MNIKQSLFIAVILLTTPSCSLTPQVRYITEPVSLYHPTLPDAPYDLSKIVKGPIVVTKDNMGTKIDSDKAYIAFSYPDWLEFAKWMKTDKEYKEKLLKVIDTYSKQDHTIKKSNKELKK